jgi:hypothetical protein
MNGENLIKYLQKGIYSLDWTETLKELIKKIEYLMGKKEEEK